MTSRLDTTDLLEKRVRSRFGGRTINVWPENNWVEVLKRTFLNGLSGDTSREGREFDKAWTDEVEVLCEDKKVLRLLDDWKSISNVIRTLYKTIVSGCKLSRLQRMTDERSLPTLTVPDCSLYLY